MQGIYAVTIDGRWWVPIDHPYLAWLASLGWETITPDRMN